MGVSRRIRNQLPGFLADVRVFAYLLKRRGRFGSLVIHKQDLTTRLPVRLTIPLICRRHRGSLSRPDNLTILLVHNYPEKTLMERSLEYQGILDYTVLRAPADVPWRSKFKIEAMHRYLQSDQCSTEYVMYCDSCDAVLCGDPARAIDLLDEHDCDVLFSCTTFAGGYEGMRDDQAFAQEVARGYGFGDGDPIYINAGVWIGRTAFMRQLMEEALCFVTDQDISLSEFKRLRREGTLCEALPEYPRGVGSDQVIMRSLHRRHHPRIKIDYSGRLATPRAGLSNRILDDDEIRALWAATNEMGSFGDFVKLLLLTGQRQEKVAEMRWEDLTEDGVWTIATEAREKGNPRTLRMPPQALDIIRRQPRALGNPYVFVTPRGVGPINGFKKRKAALDEKMPTDMPPWVLHDLSLTARSLMLRAGIMPHISGLVLGHTNGGVEGVYDRHSYQQEKTHALNRLADLIENIVTAPEGGNAVSIST